MIDYIRKISPQKCNSQASSTRGLGWLMGLCRAFPPLVLRRGFLLPSCQLSFYICICRRNAKVWNLNIEFPLLSFVIDFGVVTRFLIYSLAHIFSIPTFCSFVIIISITCHSIYSMPSDIHLMSFCIFVT